MRNYFEARHFCRINFETVERYNSLLQLRDILKRQNVKQDQIETILKKYIFPENGKDDVRLPNLGDIVERRFNRFFEKALSAELMGNCLRFVAFKGNANQIGIGESK